MQQTDALAVTFYSSPDSLAFPSEWPAESLWLQKWLGAPPVLQRSRPTLATAGRGLLLLHPRAAATIPGRLREVQLQTRAASVGILCSGMLKYPRQSLASLTVSNKISKYDPRYLKEWSLKRSEAELLELSLIHI